MTVSSDRLDRIEAILANIAERQERAEAQRGADLQAWQAQRDADLQAWQAQRGADLQAWQAQRDADHQLHQMEMAEIRSGLRETRAVCDSNARAIQTWESRINEVEEESEERDSQQAVDIQTIGRMFWSAVEQQRSDRRQWQERWEQWQEHWEQQQAEWGQRFDNLLQEARADRQQMAEAREANEAEHRAFTQNSQVLLAEIARLWRRLAG